MQAHVNNLFRKFLMVVSRSRILTSWYGSIYVKDSIISWKGGGVMGLYVIDGGKARKQETKCTYAEDVYDIIDDVSEAARRILNSPVAAELEKSERDDRDSFEARYEGFIRGMPDCMTEKIPYVLAEMEKLVHPMFHADSDSTKRSAYYDFADLYSIYLFEPWGIYIDEYGELENGDGIITEIRDNQNKIEERLLECIHAVMSAFPDDNLIKKRMVLVGLYELSSLERAVRYMICCDSGL